MGYSPNFENNCTTPQVDITPITISKMSNKTFCMSPEDQVETTGGLFPHRGLQLALSSGNHYNNASPSPGASSPDSSRSMSNPSDRDTSSPPDVNMLECCLSEGSCGSNTYNTQTIASNTLTLSTLPEDNVLSGVSMNLNQTFIATAMNGSWDILNENLSLLMNTREMESEEVSKDAETGGDRTTVTSPDSAERDSQLDPNKTSPGSSETGCCSLSSSEMVIRGDSFCLLDERLPVLSSLEESSISPAMDSAALIAEAGRLSATLPDVCKGLKEQISTEGVKRENTGPLCLGMTFTQADWELPAEENDIATSNSLVALPSEHEGGTLRTFIIEAALADSLGVAPPSTEANAEAILSPCFNESFTPGQGKTFMAPVSAMQDAGKEFQTSTPVQNIVSKMDSFPSFSESLCTGNRGSPVVHPAKQQQIPLTPKQRLIARLPPAARVNKMEIKKFPKPDFSAIKSKIVTRSAHQLAGSGPAPQQKPSQVNVHSKQAQVYRRAHMNTDHAKVMNSTTVVSTTTKTVNDAQRGVNTEAAYSGTALIQSDECDRKAAAESLSRAGPLSATGEGEGESGTSLPELPAETEHASSVHYSHASPEREQAASSQVVTASAQCLGNQTFCFSPSAEMLDKTDQSDPSPAIKFLKEAVSNRIGVRSASVSSQDRPPVPKTRPRCTSESSSTRPPKENKTTPSLSSTFTRAYIHLGQSKPGNLKGCTQDTLYRPTETRREAAENSTREVRKISLVAASSKSTAVGVAGARCDRNKSRFGVQPSSRMCSISAKAPPASQPLAASPGPRSASLPNRQRQGTLGRNECSTSKAIGTLQPKQRSTAANQRAQATEELSLRAPSTTGSTKTSVNGSRPPHIPIRHTGPTSAPASRLPYKPQGVPRSLGASVHNGQSGDTGITQGGVAHRPTAFKSVVLRARLISTGRSTGPNSATACRTAASTNQGSSKTLVSPLKKSASSRLVHLTSVDKNKPRASSQQQQPQQQAAQPVQSNGPPDLLPAANYQDQSLQQLRASNRRFEAMAVVLQQTLAKHDEATRQRRELSQELVTLRGELVCSVHSCERLEKDKEELHVALQDTLQNLQEQHQKDLAQLEERLQSFYQAEWDKVLLTYQEEADKCKALMEQQMGELKANHEAMKLETEASHSAKLQYVEQQCEDSLEELKKVHSQELQSLDKTLKEAEAALLEQIQERTVENNVLIEKLKAEENRRKELAEKNQKDSHTLYLEQELESLKVVLDIKNKQLHQQEKKLMQMDKMAEKNVKLDESFQRVQQENEDLKARMDRHAALSRQLSTEQAVLHESLQKESKVNKRLSMENEELLWKLHNGDPSSPRKSPTSPSHSLSFQSPRSPAMFSSPPVSPR